MKRIVVDYDPFAPAPKGYKRVPVDYDPFAQATQALPPGKDADGFDVGLQDYEWEATEAARLKDEEAAAIAEQNKITNPLGLTDQIRGYVTEAADTAQSMGSSALSSVAGLVNVGNTDYKTKLPDFLEGPVVTAIKVLGRAGWDEAQKTADALDATSTPKSEFADSFSKQAADYANAARANLSPEEQAAAKALAETNGFVDTAVHLAKHPGRILRLGADSIPFMAAGGGAGALVTRAGLPGALAANLGTQGVMSASSSAQEAKGMIDQLPDEELSQLPEFQALLTDYDAPTARKILSQRANDQAFAAGILVNAATLGLTAKLPSLERIMHGEAGASASRLVNAGRTVVGEAIQEGSQGAGEQIATNIGASASDSRVGLTDKVGQAALLEGIVGAPAGAVGGFTQAPAEKHKREAEVLKQARAVASTPEQAGTLDAGIALAEARAGQAEKKGYYAQKRAENAAKAAESQNAPVTDSGLGNVQPIPGEPQATDTRTAPNVPEVPARTVDQTQNAGTGRVDQDAIDEAELDRMLADAFPDNYGETVEQDVSQDAILASRNVDEPTTDGMEVSELSQVDPAVREYVAREIERIDGPSDALTEGMRALAKNPRLFRTPKYQGADMQTIAGEAGIELVDSIEEDIDGTVTHVVNVDQGKAGVAPVHIMESPTHVWIDASRMEKGAGGGDAIYSAAISLAANTGKKFKEDQAGVSDAAVIRRPVQEASGVLKYDRADMIERGANLATQRTEGPNNRPIPLDTDTRINPTLRETLLTMHANATLAVPEVKGIRYDADSNQFRRQDGSVVSDADFERLAGDRFANPVREAMVRESGTGGKKSASPVGINSLKAAALIETLKAATEPGVRTSLVDKLGRLASGSVRPGALGTLEGILPSRKIDGQPYSGAPNSLMGFRKNAPNKGFSEQNYKHVEFVRVTWPNGETMLEAQRGLNKSHALERARRNWADAEIESVPRSVAETEDAQLVADVDAIMPSAEAGPATKNGVTTDAIRDTITRSYGYRAKRLLDSGRTKIVQSERDVPAEIRSRSEPLASADGTIQGFYDQKTGDSYLIADNFKRIEDVGPVFLHEEGVHAGMKAILGNRFDAIAKRLGEIAENGNATDKAIAAKAKRRAERAGTPDKYLNEEWIAYTVQLAEQAKQANELGPGLRRWLKSVYEAISAWAAQRGLKNLSINDLRVIAIGTLGHRARVGENVQPSRTDKDTITVDGKERSRLNSDGKPIVELRDALSSASDIWLEGDKPSLSKMGVNSLQLDVKALSDSIETEPFLSEGYGGIDIPSRRMMLDKMFSVISSESKILDSVVRAVPIDVMNHLFRGKLPSDGRFHDKAMLEDVFSVNSKPSVSLDINVASAISDLLRSVASYGTESAKTGPGPVSESRSTALLARDSNLGAPALSITKEGFGPDDAIVMDRKTLGASSTFYGNHKDSGSSGFVDSNTNDSILASRVVYEDPMDNPEKYGLPKPMMKRGGKRLPKHFDENYDDLLDFIALHGGLHREEWQRQGIDPAQWNTRAAQKRNRRFHPRRGNVVFRQGAGMTPADLREKMEQWGFMQRDSEDGVAQNDDNDAISMVFSALNQGEKYYTTEGQEVQSKIAGIKHDFGEAQRHDDDTAADVGMTADSMNDEADLAEDRDAYEETKYADFEQTNAEWKAELIQLKQEAEDRRERARIAYREKASERIVSAEDAAKNKRQEAASSLGVTGPSLAWELDEGRFEGGMKAAFNRLREQLQDKYLSVLGAQGDIEKVTGELIKESQNVYRRENLMHGRATAQMKNLKTLKVDPIKRLMKSEGVSLDAIEDFMEARAAPSRNRYIATINPDMPDGGSGMTTAEAKAFMSGKSEGLRSKKALSPEMRKKIEGIVSRIDGVRDETRARLLESGQITQEQYDQIKANDNYAPLRDSKGNDIGVPQGYSGKGLDVRGKPIQQALGRGTGNRAENILANVFGDAEKSIIEAERTRVGQTLLRLVLANPNKEVWEAEPIIIERKFSESQGIVYDAIQAIDNDPGSVRVMVKGKPYRIVLKDARMAAAVKNLGAEQLNSVFRFLGAINRYFSAILTRYNPSFVPINMIRDLGMGIVGITAEHGARAGKDAVVSYLPAMRALWREARGKSSSGQAGVYAREFTEAGGRTGFHSYQNVEEITNQIRNELKSVMQIIRDKDSGALNKIARVYSKGATGIKENALIQVIEDANDTIENSMRLAAFIARRKKGHSIESAAEYAKNVTVNFNRRGHATSVVNSMFLFFNAATQGSVRTFQLLKQPKVMGVMAGLASLQFVLAAIAMGDEDDDGVSAWEKIPDYEKERNLIFPIVGEENGRMKVKLVKVPMPYGFNFFPYMGGRLAQAMKSSSEQDTWKLSNDLGAAAIDSVSPVKFTGGTRGYLPYLANIFVSLGYNKNDFGDRITNEQPYSAYEVPRASLGRASTPEIYHKAAKALNRVGGGDEVTPPKIMANLLDWSPEDLKYLTEAFTGGIGRTLNQTVGLGQKAYSGLDLSTSDVPVLKSIIADVDMERATQGTYYERKESIARETARVRAIYSEKGKEAALEHMKETPALDGMELHRFKTGKVENKDGNIQLDAKKGGLYYTYKQAEKALSEITEELKAVRQSDLPMAERLKKVEDLEKAREAAQRKLNVKWRDSNG